jgi:hypothetical protein
MSSRRRLLSRPQGTQSSSSIRSDAVRDPTVLPPYQPPSCHLSAKGRRDLEAIATNHDYRKFDDHLKTAVAAITNYTADSIERIEKRRIAVQRMAAKRQNGEGDEHAKSEAQQRYEDHIAQIEAQVIEFSVEAEKAMRDLIDRQEELAQRPNIFRDLNAKLANTPVPPPPARSRPGRRQRSTSGSDEDFEAQDEDYAQQAEPLSASIVSPTELLNKARADYTAAWTSKTKRARYGDHNDYKSYKGVIHNAHYPAEDAPPVPHSRTWFPDEENSDTRQRHGRHAGATVNGVVDDDDDDDVVIAKASTNLKCPLTLKLFDEPYSNRKCPHVFEKSAILDYHGNHAVAFQEGGRRQRGQPAGLKRLQCPQTGCEAMLELNDFYVDALVVRQVKRAKEANEREQRGYEDDEDDSILPISQRGRPAEIKSDGPEADENPSNAESESRASVSRVKRERLSSTLGMRGISQASRPTSTPYTEIGDDDDDELIDEV